MTPQPPKRIWQFLRWFCREEYLEEFEGDLLELFEETYEQSPQKARLQFSLSVLRYFRPQFIKFFHSKLSLNPLLMLQNDLKIAWRNLKKQPFFTLLNTFGLAIGMAGCLLITLFIIDEFSFNKMFKDADRIYRLTIDNRTGGETNKYATVPGPLAEAVTEDYPNTELVTRFKSMGDILLRPLNAVENVKEEQVVAVDSSFFEMFGLELLIGDPQTALKEPNTLILTRTAAEKHFDIEHAVGQSLRLDDHTLYVVTGVIEDLPEHSFLRDYGVFLSIESFDDAKSEAWNKWNYPTFVKLLPGSNPEHFQAYLNTVKERYLIPWAMTFIPDMTIESSRAADKATGNFMHFGMTPLLDIHLHSNDRHGEFNPNSDIRNIYILSVIALFLILLAAVNFMNLSTAYALKRAKEVGIRKTLGSNRLGLVRQFLTEAGVLTFCSFLLALSFAQMALPFFNQISGKAISIPLFTPSFWLITLVTVAVLGLLSGAYPAFFMSGFMPVKVLKGGSNDRLGGGKVRNFLVVFQFAVSVFLMVCTLVVFQQLRFIQHKDLGFEKDQVLILDDIDVVGNQLLSFKQEVEKLSKIEHVSLSSFLPTPSNRKGVTLFPEGKVTDSESALILQNWDIDYDYISTLDLEIIAGRNFNRNTPTDSSGIILNQSAVVMLGVEPEEALGIRLTSDFHRPDKENMAFSTVIGVVKNFHFESLKSDIGALTFSIGNAPNKLITKINPGDFQRTINDLERIWNKMAPGQPFHYYFLDDSFNDTYQTEQRLGTIFFIFTMLSILIACLGLFGLAAFNVEKRVKEIGIRKVLGASVSQIMYHLSVNFLKLVTLGILIAIPFSWYVMNKWLADFSYRIDISWWVFVIATVAAILIALITVSFQSLKAAITNPVKSLKSE